VYVFAQQKLVQEVGEQTAQLRRVLFSEDVLEVRWNPRGHAVAKSPRLRHGRGLQSTNIARERGQLAQAPGQYRMVAATRGRPVGASNGERKKVHHGAMLGPTQCSLYRVCLYQVPVESTRPENFMNQRISKTEWVGPHESRVRQSNLGRHDSLEIRSRGQRFSR